MLYEAINEGANAFKPPRTGDVEILLTASEENFGAKMQQNLEQQLSLSGIRLFGISFDVSKLPAQLPKTGTFVNVAGSFASAEAVSRSSGGMWMRAQGAGAIDEAGIANVIANLTTNFFVLRLQLARPLAKAEDLKVEVLSNGRIPPKDILLLHSQRIYPCQ